MTTFRISNPEPPRIVIAADTEDRRTGTVEFRITNEASTYKRLAFSFVVLDAADHNAPDAPEGRWLATDGPGEGEVLAPGDSVQRIVTVSVPPGEPARDLAFRLLAYDGDRPDENADESVKIVVTLAEAVVQEVPDPPPRQRPSWLIPLLAVLGVAVPTIVVMAVLLGQEDVRHSTDLDGDGFCPEGLAEVFKPSSSKPRPGMAVCPTGEAKDCDDEADRRHPDAEEACDGADTDCDGEALGDNERDSDGDGYLGCKADEFVDRGTGELPGDCDDVNLKVNPGAAEVCDGLDTDCDGAALEAEEADTDGDGFVRCEAESFVNHGSDKQPGDCNDTDPRINPSAEEACDGIDQTDYNCDGSAAGADLDEDGFPACNDCPDTDSASWPGAPELCDNKDNDCDGVFGPKETDDDGDGVTECDGDCDDGDPDNAPGRSEACDNRDNDCGNDIDEDCDYMVRGRVLHKGEQVLSHDHRFRLVMQTDGALALYQGGALLWSSQSAGTDADYAVFQGDGNLVVYSAAGHARWSASTHNRGGDRAIVQNDGNFVVYAGHTALWASNTCCRCPPHRAVAGGGTRPRSRCLSATRGWTAIA